MMAAQRSNTSSEPAGDLSIAMQHNVHIQPIENFEGCSIVATQQPVVLEILEPWVSMHLLQHLLAGFYSFISLHGWCVLLGQPDIDSILAPMTHQSIPSFSLPSSPWQNVKPLINICGLNPSL